MQFAAGYVFPYLVEGVDVGRVASERGHVGHARIHIGGAHGVAAGDGIGLFDYFAVRFDVSVAGSALVVTGPARIQHEFSQVEIARIAGNAV